MANYKAVANGNWSALATWQDNSTGSFIASTVLPGASDVVYFNNFTVQINVDVTVSQIRNDSTTGVTAGGSGVISASRTVNANLFHSTGTLITISATSPSVVNITGNMPGTLAQSNSNGINCTGNATLNYVGDIQASILNFCSSPTGIRLAIGSTLNLTGNIVGGLNGANFGAQSSPIGVRSNTNAIINVVGNVTGGPSGIFNYGILQTTGDNVTITGLVSGGFGSIGGQYNAGVFGGGLSLTIFGNLIGGNNAPAIWNGGAAVRMYGNIQNASNGFAAVFGVPFFFVESTTQYEFRKLDLTTNTLYTPGVATGHPATNNVRTGIVYGPTSNLTGTCAVPPAAAVSLGVPVDNTVGTASLDANALAAALNTSLSASLPTPISASLSASLPTPISASLQASLPTPIATALNTSLSASLPAAIAPLLWDESVTNITTPNSIGERLKNCSTVATTGAQIASFNP
jgi:hypothetical protein